MKKYNYKLLILFAWYLFVNSSRPSDKWIVFFENEKSIHTCKREDYLKIMEMIEVHERKENYKNYLKWEFEEKFLTKVE